MARTQFERLEGYKKVSHKDNNGPLTTNHGPPTTDHEPWTIK